MERHQNTLCKIISRFFPIVLLSMVPFLSLANASSSLVVCKTCAINTVTDALKLAQAGDTIQIQAGRYHENNLLIRKPSIHIQGEPGAVLDGNGEKSVLGIQADDASVTGLTIQNSGRSYIEELAGIKIHESKHCAIENNQFLNNTYGVYLSRSSDCKIRNNTFHGAPGSESEAGNGIHVWSSEKLEIENNKVFGHRDGIYLEFSSDSQIRNNFIQDNQRYGLHFMSSNRNTFFQNTFSANGSGVAVMYSHEVIMKENTFEFNSGSAAYGLLLKEINASHITQNKFLSNTVGIFMEGANRSQFEDNEFKNNGWALRITASCENNEFTHNNFLGNTFDVATNSSTSPNKFSENYWSHYNGYDLNHDGIGDVPFRPVSISSVIMERVDSSYILLNSFFFSLLDEVERALPELIPQELIDERPLMKAKEIK